MDTPVHNTVNSGWTRTSRFVLLILFAVFFYPLVAAEVDWGVGIGLVHSTYRTRGEMPDFAHKIKHFRDFPTISLEASIPISQYLKLNARLYPHSRNFTLWNRMDTDVVQLIEYYLDLPLSVRGYLRGLEVGAGLGLGFKFTDVGIEEFYDTDFFAGTELPFLMPSFNLSMRMPLDKKGANGLSLEYHQDLGPFSDAWDYKVYHKRVVAELSHRFMGMDPRSDLIEDLNLNQGSKKVNLALGAGFQVNRLYPDHQMLVEFDDYEAPRLMWLPAIDMDISIHPSIQLHTGVSLNRRKFSLRERGYWQKSYKCSASYVDLPLMLQSRIAGMELGVGANLSILTNAKYNLSPTLSPQYEPHKAAAIIPAAGAGIKFNLKGKHSLNFLYSHDLIPFSTNYGIDKDQEQLKIYWAYSIMNTHELKDILPVATIKQNDHHRYLSVGGQAVLVKKDTYYRPMLAYESTWQYPSGCNLGWRFTGSTGSDSDTNSFYLYVDGTIQPRIGYRYAFIEPWVAAGGGAMAGIAGAVGGYFFVMLPFVMPKVSAELGLRFHLTKRLNMDASWQVSRIPNLFLPRYTFESVTTSVKGPSLTLGYSF